MSEFRGVVDWGRGRLPSPPQAGILPQQGGQDGATYLCCSGLMSKSRRPLLCLADRPLDLLFFSFCFRRVKYSRTTALRCSWSSRACRLMRGMLRVRKALTKASARWAPACCVGTRRPGAQGGPCAPTRLLHGRHAAFPGRRPAHSLPSAECPPPTAVHSNARLRLSQDSQVNANFLPVPLRVF